MFAQERIRNFSIIAHIDHGKSTLADRLLEITGAVDDRTKKDQILDSMDIEKERGITIKAQTARINFKASDGKVYNLNLIDTPGHVDFSYEVSRSLMACEGVILLVDASQGIEAQTLAHFYTAMEHNLEIIPVINKIDLPSIDLEDVIHQIEHDLALEAEKVIKISAKKALGITELLEAIVRQCPPPKGDINKPLKALIYDAYYDDYRGVVCLIRVFEGQIKKGDRICFFQTEDRYEVEEVGFFKITRNPKDALLAGEVGYVIANIKSLENVKSGDTITLVDNPTSEALPGFKEVKSFVFASIYPIDSGDYQKLKESLQKLKLNDASLSFEPENSQALGAGYRCGFLGLLHFEIIQERLRREFALDIIVSTPSVRYNVLTTSQEEFTVDSPMKFPEPTKIEKVFEPFVRVDIYTPKDYLGNVLSLCQEKRGIQTSMNYIDEKRVEVVYSLPLAEIIFDFHDKIKSLTKGYATFDYEFEDYREAEIEKVDVYINKKKVDAFSFLTHKDNAVFRGRFVVSKLKEVIHKHLFQIPLQAAIGHNVIARETISAMRKDVTSKCYGGDISRKKKLLDKQKQGKKKMQMVGNVEIPQEAFVNVFKGDMEEK
ncbi:MAG TPA: elongation factor 4 [Spirochaetia bacterium]|nr:MAG: elongation factor 4 [Spirochaetes bacterium GWB1_36_13]HCL57650.1 elongation factor 4 [Spirochaetia bacterium]